MSDVSQPNPDTVAKIVMKRRHFGGYRYHKCKSCGNEDTIQKPIEINLPYCGSCGMSIVDAAHKFCGWCGISIEYKMEVTHDPT